MSGIQRGHGGYGQMERVCGKRLGDKPTTCPAGGHGFPIAIAATARGDVVEGIVAAVLGIFIMIGVASAFGGKPDERVIGIIALGIGLGASWLLTTVSRRAGANAVFTVGLIAIGLGLISVVVGICSEGGVDWSHVIPFCGVAFGVLWLGVELSPRLDRSVDSASQLKRAVPACCGLMVLCIMGCIHHVGVPIWTKDTVVFYPDLVGQYRVFERGMAEPMSGTFQLTAGADKTYTVTYYDDKGVLQDASYELRFVKLAEFTFISLNPKLGTKAYQDELAKGLGFPQSISRVSFEGKDFVAWGIAKPKDSKIDYDPILDHVEINTKEVVVRNATTGKSEKERTIDMTTGELQSFLIRHGAEFSEKGWTLKWIGPVR